MKTSSTALALALAISAVCSVAAYAAKLPHPLATDSRVRQVMFDPNQVYELVGTYGYQTSVEFAQDEQVKVVALGDTIAWQYVTYQNRVFLKPVEPDAVTNMTVITDKRTYYFRLNSSKPNGSLTFNVRFEYPNQQHVVRDKASSGIAAGSAPSSCSSADPGKVNLNYSFAGQQKTIGLKRAFDDGQFTCLLFDPNTEIPSIYLVGANGTESIVNTRREGDYLVIERTGAQFTLRNGDAHLCLRNNQLNGRPGRADKPLNGEVA